MENSGDSSHLIGFWTGAKYGDIKALVEKAGLDFPYVVSELKPNSVCLAMGASRLKNLQEKGAIPKRFKTIEAARGQVFVTPGGPVMVTFDPNLAGIRADAPSQIIWDIRLAYRYAVTGSLQPIVGKYEWADDLAEVIEQVNRLYSKSGVPVAMACDTETMGLDPLAPGKEIVTVQVSVTEGSAVAVYCLGMPPNAKHQLIHQVRWLLTTPKVRTRAANWKYDAGWLWHKWGIECTNFSMDTTLIGSMLDENRSNSLKWHVKEYTDMGGYEDAFEKTHDKGHMEKVPRDDPNFLTYAAGDADGTLRVSNVMIKKISLERYSARLYSKLVHPALKAFEKVERRGVIVDKKAYAELKAELRIYIDQKEKMMVGLLPGRLRAKLYDKITERIAEGKEPLTPSMKADFFFDKQYGLGLKPKMMTEKSEKPSTAHEHLTMFGDIPEAAAFVACMKELGSARKALSTYVEGFLAHLRSDGRFHPCYMLFKGGMFDNDDSEGGTNTGRLSAQNPAWQTVPKHNMWAKKIRRAFPAPPGKVCWSADFSQGELRVVASVANENRMIEAYRKNQDLHCLTASTFAGYLYEAFVGLEESDPDEYKKWRQRGKTGNFGMLYDISANGFVAFAWRSGIQLTEKEAQGYLNAFFDMYPDLKAYHQKQKNFASQNGFVVSPLGRIRHLPLIRSGDSYTRGRENRRAINSPIQSCLSDLCLWSVARIEEELGDEASIVGMIHDQLHGYVDEHKAKVLIPHIKQIMEELPYKSEFDWNPALTFPTDAEWGPNLGAMEKFKLAV